MLQIIGSCLCPFLPLFFGASLVKHTRKYFNEIKTGFARLVCHWCLFLRWVYETIFFDAPSSFRVTYPCNSHKKNKKIVENAAYATYATCHRRKFAAAPIELLTCTRRSFYVPALRTPHIPLQLATTSCN